MTHIPSSKSTIVYRLSILDVVAAVVSPAFALWIRAPRAFAHLPPMVLATYVLISVCFSLWFFMWFRIGRSLPRDFSIHDAAEIAKAALFSVTSTAAFAFTFTRLDQVPRSAPAIHFLALLAMLLIVRLLHRRLALRRESRAASVVSHDDEKNILIVGAGALTSLYVGFLQSDPHAGQRVAAILDDDASMHGRSILGHTIIGGSREAAALVDDFAQHGVKISTLVICDQDRLRASAYRDRLEPLCNSRGMQLELLIEKLGAFESAPDVKRDSAPRPVVLANAGYFRAKRAFEMVIAAFALIVFLPVMVLTSLLVLASSGPPAIFWQRRVGRHGRTIFVYKFKTMRNAVDWRGRLLSADERISSIGQFLRATRLDELPQLINVITGDMAIIGPRPLLPIDQPADPSLRLAVAPGLTGWAQINGGKLVSVEEKNALDEWYVRNASLRLDAKIVWRTVLTVLTGDRRDEDQLAAALARARKEARGVGDRQIVMERGLAMHPVTKN